MDYSKLALFTDLDGTLFDSNCCVSPETRAALARFQAGGGLFAISTGRAPLNASDLLPGISTNTWSVVLNGAEAYDFSSGCVAFPHVISKISAAPFMSWVLEKYPEINVVLYTEGSLLFLTPMEQADDHFVRTHQPAAFAGLEQTMTQPWLKILFYGPRPVLEHLEDLAMKWGILEVADRVYTSVNSLEFLPKGIHKGRCLHDLRSMDELQDRTIVAVGDWSNDLELLEEADIPAAVENALPEVKAKAKILLPSNNHHAIAHLIDNVFPTL